MPTTDPPHGRKLRTGRHSAPGQIYLLTTVTAHRIPVFADFHRGRIVVQAMRYHHDRCWVSSLAFVVMPDHVHWLIQLCDGCTLAGLMWSFKRYTSQQVNRHRGVPGEGLWQRGYHDHAVRRDEDIAAVARYVVTNPLRAGLVQRIGDYSLWDAVWV